MTSVPYPLILTAPSPIDVKVTGYWAEVDEGEDEAVDAIVVEEALVGATDLDSISESALEVA